MSPEDITVTPCATTRPGQSHYYAAGNGFDVYMQETTVNNIHTARWQAVHLECGAFFECHTSGIGGNATAAKVIAWDAARRHRCADGQPDAEADRNHCEFCDTGFAVPGDISCEACIAAEAAANPPATEAEWNRQYWEDR